jgi:hypothetical protein
MKLPYSMWRHFVALMFMLAAMPGISQATILTFDEIREPEGAVIPTISGNPPETDYGDHANGSPMNVAGGQFTYGNGGEGFTPSVVVDLYAGSATAGNPGVSLWGNGYGDLTNVLIGNNNSISLYARLTADAGFAVQLYGFDLGGWPASDYTINAVRVLDGSGTLFAQNNVLVQGDGSGPGHTTFDFTTPLTAAELLIEIDYSNLAGNQQDNIGLDNIRFGQTPPAPVPEPASWLLLLLGVMVGGIRLASLRYE